MASLMRCALAVLVTDIDQGPARDLAIGRMLKLDRR
jgi:hypothetical protein